MVDGRQLRVLLARATRRSRHCAHAWRRRAGGLPRTLDRGVGRECSSWSSSTSAVTVQHRDDGAVEAAVGRGLGRARCCDCQRVAVHVGAAEALERGDQVGADALGHESRWTRPLPGPPSGAAVRAHGHADMDSTPPATIRSSQPERTLAAARLTASRPDAQKRLSCTPECPRPSRRAARRCGQCCRPARRPASRSRARRHRPGSSPACGASAWPRKSVTNRSTGVTSCSVPVSRPLPRGVRMASKM